MVTYTPGGSVQLDAALAVPIVAAAKTMVSLSSMLLQSFGTTDPGFKDITLLPATPTPDPSGNNVGYWALPGTEQVQPKWYIDGIEVTTSITITPTVTCVKWKPTSV